MKRWLTWIVVALTLGSLVVGDLLMTFAQAREATLAVPPPFAAAAAAEGGTVHVAQLFGTPSQQPQKKKRRTLMDMLFGGGNDVEPPRQQQQPRPQTIAPKSAPAQATLPKPPATPAVDKSPSATRLAVMGDSLAVDLANALEQLYAEDPNLLVVPMGVGSSSFVRPDFFDWNRTAVEEIAKNSFDLAVVIIGINDRQAINVDGQSYKALSEEWQQIYRQRVADFVGRFRAANKPLIWVGLPPMQATSYGQAIAQISALQRLAVFGGGAEFVDIFDRFLDENGKYSSFGPDLNGQRARMRKDDGIHFSAAGADKLAFYVNQTIKLFYRGGGGIGFEVADPLAGTDSQLMLRPPYQGLGEIRLLELAGPVIPLTSVPKRAAELVTATGFQAVAADAFDTKLMIEAPVGRVDAFGVGVRPEVNLGGR